MNTVFVLNRTQKPLMPTQVLLIGALLVPGRRTVTEIQDIDILQF